MFCARVAASVRTPTVVNPRCKFAAAEFCAKRNRSDFDGNCRSNRRSILPDNRSCTAVFLAAKFFALCDQSVAVGIPPAHAVFGKFRLREAQPASALRRCVLVFQHVNEGGTSLGSDLEAQCCRRMRGVRIRRRDFAGGILSLGVRRQRRSSRHRTGHRLQHRRASLSGVLFC